MDAVQQFEVLRRDLIGRTITFVRLACNSLLLYVECEPGDKRGLTFWLEPTWHVVTPAGVVAGSRQAQGTGEDGPTKEELDAINKRICDALLDRPIREIRVDTRSQDLEVTVEGENSFRTFVSDPDDDYTWHIRENLTSLQVCASPSGLVCREGRA